MEINELYLVPGHKTNAQNCAFCWSSLPNATPAVKMPKPLPPKCGRRATSANHQVLPAHCHQLSHDRHTGLTVKERDSQTDRQMNGHCIMPPTPSIMDGHKKRSILLEICGQQPSNSTTHRVAKMLRLTLRTTSSSLSN